MHFPDVLEGYLHHLPRIQGKTCKGLPHKPYCVLNILLSAYDRGTHLVDFAPVQQCATPTSSPSVAMKGRTIRGRSNTNGSTTSNQTRPVSRASTASVNTTDEQPTQTTQPAVEASQFGHRPDLAHNQYLLDGYYGLGRQQIGNSNEQHIIDPSLQHQDNEQDARIARATTVDSVQHGQTELSVYAPSNIQSFQDKDNDSFVNINDGSQDEAGLGNLKKKKGSASSIANDQELRRLYQDNKTRTLRDVADSVLQEERGPRSEKTKQIFAMIW